MRRDLFTICTAAFVLIATAMSGAADLPGAWAGAGARVSFKRDVMAVLSRAGCNGGSCHGNFEGKGGFRLSIFGEDPAFDLAALLKSRTRVDLEHPADSLILRKPTLQTKHEGGKRFEIGSPQHQILLAWVQQGAKDDPPRHSPADQPGSHSFKRGGLRAQLACAGAGHGDLRGRAPS